MSAEGWPQGTERDGQMYAFAAALPEVYGYLVARGASTWTAEDLTSETFIAAVSALRRGVIDKVTVPWLIVVARRRLVDHWRHSALERRYAPDPPVGDGDDPGDAWDEPIDVVRCRCAMHRLGDHHRAALTLRYVDGLSVTDVARELGRGYAATEALLHRARRALRRAYEEEQNHG